MELGQVFADEQERKRSVASRIWPIRGSSNAHPPRPPGFQERWGILIKHGRLASMVDTKTIVGFYSSHYHASGFFFFAPNDNISHESHKNVA